MKFINAGIVDTSEVTGGKGGISEDGSSLKVQKQGRNP